MTTATDACPGCGQRFAPRGLSNHLRLSHDPHCASAWDNLQPTYSQTLNREPPPTSLVTDVEMIDLSYTESATQSEQSNQSGDTNMDTDMSQSGDNSTHDGHPQSVFEEAPNLVTHPSNIQPLVIFDSDTEDSDDDGDQDQTPYLQ